MVTEDESRRGGGLDDTRDREAEPKSDPAPGAGPTGTNPTRIGPLDSIPPPADEPLPRVLEGRWRLEREIAAGGMGRVFEAQDLTLGTRVAVKLLHAERLHAPEAVHRFLREARLAGVANHGGIARVLDFDLTADGKPYMVMELLAGATLEARLAAPDRLGLVEGVDVLLDVLETLEAIHRSGVVHRDIKPGNIFVLAEPGPLRTKLLDFGLARGADPLAADPNLTRTGQVLGTPHYMSPEQARGHTRVGPGADLWAVGVILYELATGRRPFPGQNYNETLANILTREPPPARQVAPDLSPALEALLERCLDPDPDRRHRSAGELRRALVDLRPALTAAPPPRKGHRRRWLLAAGVAAAAGLFLIRGPAPEVAGAGLRVTWSPYQDRAYLAESSRWLLDELAARTGQSVHFAPATSYDDCIGKLVAGQVDAAGLSPASYALATARDPDLVLLARIQSNGADTYQAILVTRASSPLRAVGDARGRSFCFVDPSSTAGFVYPRAMLRSAGIDPDRDLGSIVYAGNHQRLIALLAEGGCDVAGSSTSALTQWAEEAGLSPASFRILAASDPIPGDALVARSDLPPELLARLRAATAGLIAETAAGRFPRDREISGLVTATDGDYDRVRVLVAGKR